MGEVAEIVNDGFRDSTLEDNAILTKVTHVIVAITTNSVTDEATAAVIAAARKANPRDGRLLIMESRGGSTVSAVFHILCSGMGIQALMLPVAFASLGWVWEIIILSLGFLWQLYTIWALVQLHESIPGTRYSRFLHLSNAAFGPRLGLPSTPKCLSNRPMLRAVIISYSLIALCLYSLAIVGFWAYESKIPNGGLYIAFPLFHGQDTPKLVMGLIYLLVVVNCLSTFQIYAMPVFHNLELRYTGIRDRHCSRRARPSLRVFFGCLAFFVAVALAFLGSLAPLIGGMTSTLSFVLPCFMWLAIKRPRRRSGKWWLNVGLGWLGMVLGLVMVATAIWVLVDRGINANFFHPLE